MSRFPCEYQPHGYPGACAYFYPAVMSGSMTIRERFRVCPQHAAALWSGIERASVWDELSQCWNYLDTETCAVCSKPVNGDAAAFFLTAYPVKDQRRDFYARVHDFHVRDGSDLTMALAAIAALPLPRLA